MDAIHTSVETVSEHCGYINVDVLAGWEKGIGPRRRVAGRFCDHWPPEHLGGTRYNDWMTGYRSGQRYRESVLSNKSMHFVAYDKNDNQVVVRRKGWNTPRGTVVSQLAKRGCAGDVLVYYFESSKIKRTVKCGI